MIGVVGLGAMGLQMALRLGEEASVVAFDVAPQQRALAEDGGIKTLESAEALSSIASTILLALRDRDQIETVLFGEGGLAYSTSPLMFILTSTIGIEAVCSIEERLKLHQHVLVDAPISGGPKRARNGDLLITVGADSSVLEKAEKYLNWLASSLNIVGDRVGDGQAIKTINQLLCGVHIAAAAEALTLAVALGIDPERALPVLNSGAAQSFMLGDRGRRMVQTPEERSTNVLSRMDIFVKDLGIVLAAARQAGVATPVAASAEQLFKLGVLHGFGASDDSSLVDVLAPRNED